MQAVYFKRRVSLTYRDVEELLTIRGVRVDHATLQSWVYKFTPLIETTFKRRRNPVVKSWILDEMSIKLKGQWMYQYRAVDKEGNTIDFLLTKRRNKYAAHRFLLKAISNNACPGVINIDKSGANKEAIKTYNKISFRKIKLDAVSI